VNLVSVRNLEEAVYVKNLLKQGAGRNYINALNTQIRNLQAKLNKLAQNWGPNADLGFDELGVDMLMVDESHMYKNLWFRTQHYQVGGISPEETARSTDILMKTDYINELTNEQNIVFATGTPISNSMVEAYTIQRYMQPKLLEERGMKWFDGWIGTFGDIDAELVSRVEGGLQYRRRLKSFTNIAALRLMFDEFMDYKSREDLKLKVPNVFVPEDTDIPGSEVIEMEPDEHQLRMMDDIMDRGEEMRPPNASPRQIRSADGTTWVEDSFLLLSDHGRKIGLDPQTMDPRIGPSEHRKLAHATREAYKIYEETMEEKGTQIIWSDYGVNEQGGAVAGGQGYLRLSGDKGTAHKTGNPGRGDCHRTGIQIRGCEGGNVRGNE